MRTYKILMSNLGYARGISGSLKHHLQYAHRHLYCPPNVQRKVLQQLSMLIEEHDPDLCCFAEIDRGSFPSANVNQLEALLGQHYSFFDIENKYGQTSRLRDFFLTRGKSNAFIAKHPMPHEKLFFPVGKKRLVYKISLSQQVTLLFAHFSLTKAVRAQQLFFVKKIASETPGEVILLGDFNILTGFSELAPLLNDNRLIVMNQEDRPTFLFHRTRLVLDLCICSPSVARRAHLDIVPQPYSDHAALLLEIKLEDN